MQIYLQFKAVSKLSELQIRVCFTTFCKQSFYNWLRHRQTHRSLNQIIFQSDWIPKTITKFLNFYRKRIRLRLFHKPIKSRFKIVKRTNYNFNSGISTIFQDKKYENPLQGDRPLTLKYPNTIQENINFFPYNKFAS